MNYQLLLSKKKEDIQKIQAAYPDALYILNGDQYSLHEKKLLGVGTDGASR